MKFQVGPVFSGQVRTATLGTGFVTAILSSIMNDMPTVLVSALSMLVSRIYANSRSPGAYAATMNYCVWLRSLSGCSN
ncbi:hypothetical protein Hsc_3496 [Herbaspirillum seropedicae]|nr:hypothetical protein Hsc_3496 [Herbaspirillum seropedicae]